MAARAKEIGVIKCIKSKPKSLRLVSSHPKASRAPRILLLDDDHRLREMFAEVLQSWGFQVDLFDGGSRALEFLRVGPKPNLILLDLLLRPDMNGWQFLDSLRKVPGLENIPVIAMSGADLSSSELRQCRSEVFLEKPLDVHVLRSHLEHFGLLPLDT